MLSVAVALLLLAPLQAPAVPATFEALNEATSLCRLETLKALLPEKRTDLDRADEMGTTLVHTAVVVCEPDVAKLLIERGAAVDGAPGDARHTPLMMAAVKGNVAMIEALVAAQADVNREVAGMGKPKKKGPTKP